MSGAFITMGILCFLTVVVKVVKFRNEAGKDTDPMDFLMSMSFDEMRLNRALMLSAPMLIMTGIAVSLL